MNKYIQLMKTKQANFIQGAAQSGKFGVKIESSSKKTVFDELERQTIWTFNIFMFAAVINVLAITITAGFWISGKIPEGNYAGLGSGGCLPIVWMTARKAREARDKFLVETKELGSR